MRRNSIAILLALVVPFALLAEEKADTQKSKAPTAEDGGCEGGAVLDDGSVDSGYGFVPSATEGVYVQFFGADLFPRRELDSVCVCWLKTRGDRENVTFDVVFYAQEGDRPATEPFAWIPAFAVEVPPTVDEAGAMTNVDVRGVTIPKGGAYIGVRWNPHDESYLFLCNDRSESTARTDVFFYENQARGWTHVDQAPDPIFRPHRAILVRAKALPKEAPAPPPWQPPPPVSKSKKRKPTVTALPDASSPPPLADHGG